MSLDWAEISLIGPGRDLSAPPRSNPFAVALPGRHFAIRQLSLDRLSATSINSAMPASADAGDRGGGDDARR